LTADLIDSNSVDTHQPDDGRVASKEETAMKYFTVEIEEKPIACFRCEDREDAEGILDAAYFRADLSALDGPEGKPLWDGVSPLILRKATTKEARAVERVWLADEDHMKSDDDEYIAFLVPVTDSTDYA